MIAETILIGLGIMFICGYIAALFSKTSLNQRFFITITFVAIMLIAIMCLVIGLDKQIQIQQAILCELAPTHELCEEVKS